MATYTKKTDWMELWIDDKKSIIEIMHKNMQSDIECGYDVTGLAIRRQIEEISAYTEQYHKELMALAAMDWEKANRWCFCDLLRRGAIE